MAWFDGGHGISGAEAPLSAEAAAKNAAAAAERKAAAEAANLLARQTVAMRRAIRTAVAEAKPSKWAGTNADAIGAAMGGSDWTGSKPLLPVSELPRVIADFAADCRAEEGGMGACSRHGAALEAISTQIQARVIALFEASNG